MREQTAFRARQTKLLHMLKPGSIALIPAGSLATRSNDTEFPFRQDSQFKYLLGLEEHDALLVLSNLDGKMRTILFCQEKNALAELWSGKRIGVERAKELFNADEAYPHANWKEKLAELLVGHKSLYMDFFSHDTFFTQVKSLLYQLSLTKKRKEPSPSEFVNLAPLLGRLRLIKDSNEIEFMKRAAEITNRAHRGAMALAKAGKNEKDINAAMEYLFQRDGGGNAYESIVAGGENALVLHYIENDCALRDGDLILIDAGAQFNLYASDVSRTFPVSGKFSKEQRELYQLVLDAQKSCIQMVGPGKTLGEIHAEAGKVLLQGLIELGILTGTLEEHQKDDSLKRYYPHGTSHWLGLDVHDNGPYRDSKGEEIGLAPGMVLTVEPGLYFQLDDDTVPSKYKGIGIRIEDDILVTEKGYENLTAAIPKEIKEVEEACASEVTLFC
ncbi:MAG: M24 family metallopeptidase [Halobacteriovoraceae bacterium]|jgi:Xaa-Pro aminopeptidase|nr:M24 family metallopeptidase [Halobacteriovoraceae bacterium]MBT5095421.1 M24 family metallopeptidase [Halobacteriovoraceae bacterium]